MANDRLAFVDDLRGLAVLMVILVHTGQQVPGLGPLAKALCGLGQMGVQLFFVASAYTLCLSFENKAGEPRRTLSFYVRRVFRIAPLYYLAILAYFSISLLGRGEPGGGLSPVGAYTPVHVIVNILFLNGFDPWANNNIVPGGWSIGTEVAFYGMFPALFFLAKGALRESPRRILLLALLLGATNVAAQYVISLFTVRSIKNNNFLFFFIYNQLPVFVLGMAVYFLQKRKAEFGRWTSPAFSALALALSGGGLVLLWTLEPLLWPAYFPLVEGFAFCALLNLFAALRVTLKPVARIGVVSYSMYLLHFIFAFFLVPRFLGPVLRSAWAQGHATTLLVLTYGLIVGLTYVLASFTYEHIEKRFILLGGDLIKAFQKRGAPGPALGGQQPG